MSLELLANAIFEEIGDVYVIELEPVTNLVSIDDFEEAIEGDTVDRFFTREFSYSKNNQPAVAWQTLNQTNLQAVPVTNSSDTFVFRFRYTRAGTDVTGELTLTYFKLLATVESACLMFRINKSHWDNLHGFTKFIEISEQLQKFNQWAQKKYGISKVISLVDDSSVPESNIYISRQESEECANLDINDILKTLWGNYLVDYQFKINVDVYDGVQEWGIVTIYRRFSF